MAGSGAGEAYWKVETGAAGPGQPQTDRGRLKGTLGHTTVHDSGLAARELRVENGGRGRDTLPIP